MTDETPGQCSWAGCSRSFDAYFENRPLCVAHFLEIVHRRLDLIETAVQSPPGSREFSSNLQSGLSQIISEMSLLATKIKRLHPDLRLRLMSLSERAAQLYDACLRSPRFARSVPCRIGLSMSAGQGGTMRRNCSTVNISERGACVKTDLSLQLGQIVVLERTGSSERARAKVVWIKQLGVGNVLAGLEILDADDFWSVGKRLTESSAKP